VLEEVYVLDFTRHLPFNVADSTGITVMDSHSSRYGPGGRKGVSSAGHRAFRYTTAITVPPAKHGNSCVAERPEHSACRCACFKIGSGGRTYARAKPGNIPAVQAAVATGEKWIRVALSEQKVYAYEGQALVNTFLVSTGLPRTPTVTGEFRMWTRTPIQNMSGGSRASGDYYFLRDVQWVQYFYGDYAFHGTYWHTNYGSPASRGCVNMTNEDAKWLFDWAFPQWNGQRGWYGPTDENATLVIVHP
jgi:lipoprotein-anchoring transpeptidase ErfK/SrfK